MFAVYTANRGGLPVDEGGGPILRGPMRKCIVVVFAYRQGYCLCEGRNEGMPVSSRQLSDKTNLSIELLARMASPTAIAPALLNALWEMSMLRSVWVCC